MQKSRFWHWVDRKFRFDGTDFLPAEAGTVSMLFALSLPAMLLLAGGTADYAAMTRSNARLQAAVDSAALSVAREMTLTQLSATRVQDLSASYVAANVGSDNPATVVGTLVDNNTGVRVQANQAIRAPLGVLPAFLGTDTVTAVATARVPASSVQQKLCLLSLGEKVNGGIFMHNGSAVAAPECVLHSNSTVSNAVIVQTASKVKANLLCARGGVQNLAGLLEAPVLSDCPAVNDPLVNRPEPPLSGPCLDTNKKVKSGKITLQPGVYCNGVSITKTASVTLAPGVYVFRDGPLEVRDTAELLGQGVTLMFAGKNAFFRFYDKSLIRLSAPTAGISAGMLLWDSKSTVLGTNSWRNGGCGTGGPKPVATPDIDDGSNGCTSAPTPGMAPPKKYNEHHINSDRAQELTGTIYLPKGYLLVDSIGPIANQSPFTVFVVNKMDLYDGPILTINSNYSGSAVPVPAGLGIIGAKMVMLGR